MSEVAYHDTRGHGHVSGDTSLTEKRKEWLYCLSLTLVNSFQRFVLHLSFKNKESEGRVFKSHPASFYYILGMPVMSL
jgi:hypothetical protein